jgi:nucleoside-diphosphate-sugar epimerase
MKKRYKILITGGAGYIGSMLSTKLVNLNQNVTVLDNLSYDRNSLSHLYINNNFTLIEGSVLNKKLYKKLIASNDIIIPLAGLVGAPLCEKFKQKAISVNLNSIKFLCKNVKKNQKIIYPTTNSGYGIGEKNKFCDENSKLKPISLYGKTKVQAEDTIMNIKNSISFRLATVFGVSFRMRSDLLVNNFVEVSLREKKISLFEPHFRRNFIHVRDVVNAFIFAIDNFNKMKSNVYNLGLSDANLTKLQLAKKIKKQNKKMTITFKKNKKDPDQRDYFVSNEKINKAGFKPSFSIESGIKELLIYFQNNNKNIKNNY